MKRRVVDTHWLTHASLEPRLRQPRWLQWPGIALLALCLLLVTSGVVMGKALVGVADTAAGQQRQQALQAEVERLRTELAVEHATRDEVERQAAGLNDQVAELTRQVQFLAARSGDATRPEGR
jgi:septal ring factor EnvC (AmiA/AmiB activator)